MDGRNQGSRLSDIRCALRTDSNGASDKETRLVHHGTHDRRSEVERDEGKRHLGGNRRREDEAT